MSDDSDRKAPEAEARGLRGFLDRHPQILVTAIVFGLLGLLIAVQAC